MLIAVKCMAHICLCIIAVMILEVPPRECASCKCFASIAYNAHMCVGMNVLLLDLQFFCFAFSEAIRPMRCELARLRGRIFWYSFRRIMAAPSGHAIKPLEELK